MPGTDWRLHFTQRREPLLADLAALVGHESPSQEADRVTALAEWMKERLAAAGVRAETRLCPPHGAALVAAIGPNEEGGTLLLGHHDTVWPLGSLAEMPFRVEGGRARGPGVFDMKAGLCAAMAVLEALAATERPPAVTLLSVPDEEIGTEASRELLLSVARRHGRVLVLEPSLEGAVKIARKGTGLFAIEFAGRSAHAGLEPEKGASALAELARCVLFVERIGNPELGTTVTPTVATSGTATNVVPEAAILKVDARVWSRGEAVRVESEIRGYRVADARVSVRVSGGFDRPPLEATPGSEALYERVRQLARELGLQELGAARVGGASDGNLTAAAGLVTLDGLGPRGDGAHARHEWVDVEDLCARAALLTCLVLDLGLAE